MKLMIAILIDILDFTVGRLLFATPFAGEIIGLILGYIMFGPRAFWYAVEAIDVTEQVDGFIPTMTLIALASD
ncbi:hypothetical protein [Puniceibacterium sp. IMCC21224]|uniref:hypothetical protein n=1 Tax=Puniceibacterium sp. IMCC21224 TaxID=1618204 RepID=UPI00064E1440|nr:hypothetical protein [Puniceibacterium sp. IMCC21224]KMK65998.1 hypothetical protein IMCC21224_11843 [Puniceibacterium sp. IMCC21224]